METPINSLILWPYNLPHSMPPDIEVASRALRNVFMDVYACPEWAKKLDGNFTRLDHSRTVIAKGGTGSGSLFTCINECAKAGDWGPLFQRSEHVLQKLSKKWLMTCKR